MNMSTPLADVQQPKTMETPPIINAVGITAPFRWLRLGISDFRQAPGLSLLYGLLFAGLSGGVFLLISNAPWYTVAYLTGLVVVGPFLASGLYVASRDIERGERPSIDNSLRLLIQRKTYLALFSVLLALVMAAWVRFSALLFAVQFSSYRPTIEAYTQILTSNDGWMTLGLFIGVGFILATTVFVISAVAIPMILDKDSDFITAMRTSYHAVTQNIAGMAVWAALIVVITAVGIATAFIGLAVLFPILGYATWHSYRALVK
jgi:uncharacterized membrane protein